MEFSLVLVKSPCRIWGSHSSGDTNSVFWDITPCSQLKANQSFGERCCIHLQDWRVREASSKQQTKLCFSEISADVQQNTWHYIPEDRTLQENPCGMGSILRPLFEKQWAVIIIILSVGVRMLQRSCSLRTDPSYYWCCFRRSEFSSHSVRRRSQRKSMWFACHVHRHNTEPRTEEWWRNWWYSPCTK
jgi:hypothetical protein